MVYLSVDKQTRKGPADLPEDRQQALAMARQKDIGGFLPGLYRPAWLRLLPVCLIILPVLLFYGLGYHHSLDWDGLIHRRALLKSFAMAHPLVCPLLFLAVYVAAALLSLPFAAMLTIFAGFLFGWLPAIFIVAVSATTGASIAFLVVRSLARGLGDIAPKRLSRMFQRGFREHAFVYILALRMAPFFPFALVNAAPAFFQVRLRVFAAATFVGILPATLLYAWLGSGLDQAIAAAERRGDAYRLADCLTPGVRMALAALALLALVPLVLRRPILRWMGRGGSGAGRGDLA